MSFSGRYKEGRAFPPFFVRLLPDPREARTKGASEPQSGPYWGRLTPPVRQVCVWCGDRSWPHTSPPWVASLSALVPLLAQEVLELLHELLRVEVSVTLRARRLVPCCIIGLL